MQATRSVRPFEVVSDYRPSGDQPAAIAELAGRINAGETDVVLLGATGTGKSATTAWLIEQVQRPTLVLAHNKTLAAQLATEFRELMPNNAVEYFVSYYDYYQPEAYVPQTDTFIEKDSSINAEVERLRHSTTNSLLSRRDVDRGLVGLVHLRPRHARAVPRRDDAAAGRAAGRSRLAHPQVRRRCSTSATTSTSRAATSACAATRSRSSRSTKSSRSASRCSATRSRRSTACIRSPARWSSKLDAVPIFPGSHYVASTDVMQRAIGTIRIELEERLAELEREGKLLEAQRLRMRTTFDLEMMEQIGFCSGIENYSRHIDGRAPGEAPHCLLDYFADDFLVVIDESHVTVPQIGSMYEGDSSRKRTLVEHGFRLPSALDNRPLSGTSSRTASARPSTSRPRPAATRWASPTASSSRSSGPTGLVDPQIVVKPSKGQIDDLLEEIRVRAERDERVLVTTLTKRMAEELTDFLTEAGVRVRYLHSDVDTLRRVELLTELRAGVYDVLVGINLLREGLDLPEVSLVAILDADKEGFLRSSTSLIQTIGRAARNVSGEVHMYADVLTDSMKSAIDETTRRRDRQLEYNRANGIDPQPLRKRIADITEVLAREEADTAALLAGRDARKKAPVPNLRREGIAAAGANDLEELIRDLNDQMLEAAGELKFELAARLRDEVSELKRELRQMEKAGHLG